MIVSKHQIKCALGSKRLAVASKTLPRSTKIENTRRQKFCVEYATNGGNATQAYIKAGYKATNARQSASRLLTFVDVRTNIRLMQDELFDGLMMSKKQALLELADLAWFNPQDLLDANGEYLPLRDLPASVAKSIREIKVLKPDPDSEAVITEMKFGYDKRAALDMINKHYDAYEDNKKSGSVGTFVVQYMYPQDEHL